MKNTAISFCIALLTIIIGLPLYPAVRNYFAGRKVSAAVGAYTIRQHEENSAPGRTTKTMRLITIAQRSDGARSITKTVPTMGYNDRDIYFPEGFHKVAFDSVQVVSTYKINPTQYSAHLGALFDSSKACAVPYQGTIAAGTTNLGTKSISSIPTNQIQIGSDITQWMAVGMNCEMLENEHHFKEDGSTTKLILDSITYGEPDASLFTVDPTYSEVKPSEALRRKLVKINAPQAKIDSMVTEWARQDANYQSSKQ